MKLLYTLFILIAVGTLCYAGDILRGGAPSNQRNPALGSPATSAAADAARSGASDALARTTRAVDAVRNMQNAARNLAGKGINGVNVLKPGLTPVQDGLHPNGLSFSKVVSGATAPTQVVGEGRIDVTVKQTAQQAFLEWNRFNIGRGTTLYFDQSAGGKSVGQWIAFNQVKDPSGEPSQIMGQIKAQGQVYIINGNGIIFGGTSQVNVHGLVASTLPINKNLLERGLLNNPKAEFLFSGLQQVTASNPTSPFAPDVSYLPNGKIGDVEVQAGAQLTAPTNADHVGGRIALIGANVTNAGRISTPDGQAILAAGLEVGFVAHDSNDPSLRGLDVYVGRVGDYGGTVTNRGIIDAPRGNITMTGKTINQLGILTATTSVSFNGRIDLNASYDAVSNTKYDATDKSTGNPFLYKSTGTIILGENSVTRIMPETGSLETTVGNKLALNSQINMRGKAINMENNAMILAPNADVNINAGVWNYVDNGSKPISTFVLSNGQFYMNKGAMINVAGTTDVAAQLAENIVTLQLRGSEFSNTPYNRDGLLRGVDITLDLRRQGVYNGFAWAGTPLADATGYLGLIQRSVGALTTAGGNVKINAGGSVVMQSGSVIDVSGGFTNYAGGDVQTTRVMYGGHIFDISQATPDRVYDGIYTGQFTETSSRWGVSKTYTVPFMLGKHYEPGYTYGAAGGSISITAPSMALDGTVRGNTVNGPRQNELPAQASSIALAFQAQKLQPTQYPTYSPTPPTVIFQSGVTQRAADAFALDANGDPFALRSDRTSKVVLSPSWLTDGGFGHLTVDNKDGNIIVPAGEELITQPKGSVSLYGANITVDGSITSPGGSILLNAYNLSPSAVTDIRLLPDTDQVTPGPNVGRGVVSLGAGASLNTAGLIIDDRLSNPEAYQQPVVLTGGSVSINAYTANLLAGSVIDVSGGARLDAFSVRTYGNAGSLSIKAGQDLTLPSVLGGKLVLGSTLRGMAGIGAIGGSLTLQAPLIQIGGSTSNRNVLLLQPDFFNQGGFSSFTLNGIGAATGPDQYTPGLVIAPGTVIEPIVQNYVTVPFGNGEGGMSLRTVTLPEGLRSPVSLNFGAVGATDEFTRLLTVRGDVVMGAGSVIKAGPRGSVNFNGQTVAIFGSVFAPGGFIGIKGADKFPSLDQNPTSALTTVYIGPQAHLSTAGAVVLTPDAYGRRTGYVLPGGTISISGNIVAEQGAVIDVSGASGDLDVNPALLALTTTGDYLDGLVRVPTSSGLTTPVYGTASERVTIDSSGGLIVMKGGQQLFTRATLLGNAGGPTATGGALSISSGRFYETGVLAKPDDLNLVVTQTHPSGTFFPSGTSGIGKAVTGSPGMGYFAVNDFQRGGFDSLQLGGNVKFDGAININARGSLIVGTGGVIYANNDVNLTAAYVALGTVFGPPMLATQVQNPFNFDNNPYYFAPTFGPGKLTVTAGLIDIGNLSLQNIGSAMLTATNGDIRGNGTFNIAGDVTFRAAQLYPVTGVTFTIAAYDHGGVLGSVTFEKSGGLKSLPLTAGGTLNVFGSTINQNGVLRAPFGVINLGWDGTGTAPKDLITGNKLPLPTTQTLTLGAGSITSVSAIDPITGRGVLIPYGTSPTGTSWIDPAGNDITSSGLPAKAINLSGGSIETVAGSVIDIRGGGDLYAYRWVSGTTGTRDILANPNAFAVIPGYSSFFAPFGAFNTDGSATNLNGDKGYVNSGLKVGDQVYLDGGSGLRGGVYTLMPARYALMPGAFLVTPQSGNPIGNFRNPDGSSYVNGYRYNSLNGSRDLPGIYSRFEIAPASTIATRAEYQSFFANEFLTNYANERNQVVQRLPQDSGQLVFSATSAMTLNGDVLSKSLSAGRGGIIDISSPLDIVIGPAGLDTVGPGKLLLSASQLSQFGAESLLIGGVRSFGTDGTKINVKTSNVTVSNVDPNTGAVSVLSGPEIILVANKRLTVDAGSVIQQTGNLSGAADTLIFGSSSVAGSGDGTLLRVSSDPNAQIVRNSVSSTGTTADMRIGVNASISGKSIILDSTYATSLNPTAQINGQSVSLNSGQISIQLGNAGALQPTRGLVLGGPALDGLQTATSLSLLSYTTLDVYGVGGVGSATLENLAVHAGEIRGFNTAGGTAVFQAKNITIDNAANSRALGPVNAALSGTLLFDAERIDIGANSLRVSQYASLGLNATKGLYMNGSGAVAAAGAVTINTPFISATRSSTQAITAGGALTIDGGGTGSAVAGGLGATLSLSGSSVVSRTDIILPSGVININATSGNLTIGGKLDVGGTAQEFFDLTKYTDAGNITLGSSTGNVVIDASSVINVGAAQGGGDAGTLSVSAAKGTFTLAGELQGAGGASFALDVASLPTTASINSTLNGADFSGSRTFRVRTGNVLIDGTSTSDAFSLSADLGKIDVSGSIDTHGTTGGTIHLAAAQGVNVLGSAILNASGAKYDSAGKGGAITLEKTKPGAAGQVSIDAGSQIMLGVTAAAELGQFSGTLHLRAPQTGSDLDIAQVLGSVTGASSITAEGFKVYNLKDYDASGAGQITTALKNAVQNDGNSFTANDADITNRLFQGGNVGLKDVFSLQVGAEFISKLSDGTGNIVLGDAPAGSANKSWNLAALRFGSKQAPGVLTMRAENNLVFNDALSDGFATATYNSLLLNNNASLSDNVESWSYRLTAGADLSAADFHRVNAGSGSLLLGRDLGNDIALPSGANAQTSQALTDKYQVIRTGSGSIDISAGKDVLLRNQFATIYTVGTRVDDPTLGGSFDTPIINGAGTDTTLLGRLPANYAAQFALGGGNVSINAGADIAHVTRNGVLDSSRQLPLNWLSRRGYVDPLTGEFGAGKYGDIASTAWWVDYSNFFEGVGALGGGNVSMVAGRDIANVDAAVATNARMSRDGTTFVELGGGDLSVRTGRTLDAGVYYVERGQGKLNAGGSITVTPGNTTRSPSLTNLGNNQAPLSYETWLPTTLFVGKSSFDVTARGDVLMGPVSNPFLLPAGLGNTVFNKTYFTTYSADAGVSVDSLGGSVTLRESAKLLADSGSATPLLQIWLQNVLRYDKDVPSPSTYQPWLRLNESSAQPFSTVASILPASLRVTAFTGDINVVGNITLAPSPTGTLDLAAAGAINALQIAGDARDTNNNIVKSWGSSRINVSDADPASIPGISTPFAYRTLVSYSDPSYSETGSKLFSNFLSFIDTSFNESGSTIGAAGVLQTKQALHAQGVLHANDSTPLHIYAGTGDISGMTLFSPKAARVVAGQDIRDVSFYIQNTSADDVSVVSSGRDMILYDSNSVLRNKAQSSGNQLNNGETPQAGDIQISGPGTLEVLAGRNLDLGTGGNLVDGTGVGITSIGNGRNPSLPYDGANIIAAAGIGLAPDLTNSKLDFEGFMNSIGTGTGAGGHDYFSELGNPDVTSLADYEKLSPEEQKRIALSLFFLVLRDAGRDHNIAGTPGFGNYSAGIAAVSTLFAGGGWSGDITTQARDIRTKSGGDIQLLAPGGGLQLATSVIGQPLAPPGIITESGGTINIFTDQNVDIGISRIFTLRGGDEVIWSSNGNIAAGSSSKTVQSAPPTRVVIDPQSGDVKTDLAGLATGGGIGVLATVAGVAPGSVDLIAPMGTIDAGDAGIRATGNLNIAAVSVLNASNISVGGSAAGAPAAPVASAPSVGGISSNSNAAAATTSAAQTQAGAAAKQQQTMGQTQEDLPSIVTVEVIGYGGGDSDEEEDEELKKKKKQAP